MKAIMAGLAACCVMLGPVQLLAHELSPAASVSGEHRSGVEAANAALLLKWYETVLAPLDPGPVDDFVAADFVQHSALAQPGPEGIRLFLRQMREQWPEPRLTIRRIFADGDFVMGQVHQQRSEGDPGLNIVNIYRVENGRLKEHWGTLQPVEGNPLAR